MFTKRLNKIKTKYTSNHTVMTHVIYSAIKNEDMMLMKEMNSELFDRKSIMFFFLKLSV